MELVLLIVYGVSAAVMCVSVALFLWRDRGASSQGMDWAIFAAIILVPIINTMVAFAVVADWIDRRKEDDDA